jgi:signal recognition particle subunit SRP54
MIPGMGHSIPEEMLEVQEEKLKKYKYIIDSMTKKEKNNPDIINSSRVKRIATGSGTTQKDVKDLLKQYYQTKKLMKRIGGVQGLKRGALRGFAKKFGINV